MATFRDLLNALSSLSNSQLDQEMMIIPTGYCTAAPLEIDGYSPFTGAIELAVSKGFIIQDEGLDSPQCGGGVAGCFDSGECLDDLSPEERDEFISTGHVVLSPGLPYLRIGE